MSWLAVESTRTSVGTALQVWDPEALALTSTEALQQRWKITPYEDLELYGKVHATFVRGHQVYSLKTSVSKNVCGTTILKQDL